MSETQTLDGVLASTRLAWSVLFGGESLGEVDRELLRSLQDDPGTWGRLILDTWATFTALDGKRAPAGLSVRRDAGAESVTATASRTDSREEEAVARTEDGMIPEQAQSSSQRAETVASRPAELADQAEGRTGSPAVMAPASSRPEPAPAGTTQPLDFFDPDEEDESVPPRRTVTVEEVKARLTELIAEISGYPEDVFEDHLDLEVDLGIDSIKQVETLAKVREEYDLPLDEGFLMRDYATIGKMAGYIVDRLEKET
ncbi:acyl carrier protein [Streptomyces leeuwenhoekii]|uniref:Beta-Ketoacyl Synthase n=1 Tax=Streptomyces leeuwenhoekii TaxID=1437453 RepID=A0A0F7VRW9_STRLW|nr:phosphopantetheine-binding protein [Streptomyces leeuwenhoekii]CQR59586.1 Beta-Ketoacyl Synthase [Streptomyces leeuwenhoekii]